MIRASDLSVNQVLIDGVKASTGNAFGCYPVALLANVPNAAVMRCANTQAELAFSDWKIYAAESLHFIRTGQGARAVYCEFKDAAGALVLTTSALVPEFNAALGTGYQMPPSDALKNSNNPAINFITSGGRSPINSVVMAQDFSVWHDGWAVYDYNAGQPDWANVFYPATHKTDGRIVSDSSRWHIDTPEAPDSVLAFCIYPSWLMPTLPTMNLHQCDVEFDLMGEGLNLKGGQAFFWVLADSAAGVIARWYKTNEPLNIGDGVWGARNSIQIASTLDGWTKSWESSPGAAAPYFDKISSWGIGFTGFLNGDMPSGALSMRDFKIKLTA